MTTQQLKTVISYRQCREMAAAVRGADEGRSAYNYIRPRGVSGLLRSRGPLPVILYLAAAESRLVWRDSTSFAVLQPPKGMDQKGGGFKIRMLRFVNHHWDALLYILPPFTMMLLSLLLALSLGGMRLPWLLPVCLLLLTAAVLYVGVMLTAMMLSLPIRALFKRRREGHLLADSLPLRQWTLALFHHEAPSTPERLFSATTQRLERLVRYRAREAGRLEGAEVTAMQVTEVLICPLNAVTTGAMRKWLPTAQRIGLPFGVSADVVTAVPAGTGKFQARYQKSAWFFWLYLATELVCVTVLAIFVAEREAAACGVSSCQGRPATFGDALHWTVYRLFVQDPAGIHPADPGNVVMGWTVSLMGLMTLPVGIAAARAFMSARRREDEKFADHAEEVLGRVRMLVIVATKTERKAFTETARANYGRTFNTESRPPYVIFRLGSLNNSEIMLVHLPDRAGLAHHLAMVFKEIRPDFVILAGTCFGLVPAEQNQGDVVVASQSRDLDRRQIREAGTFVNGHRKDPGEMLLQGFAAAEATWTEGKEYEVHFGPMLASGALYNCEAAIGQLRAENPDAVGGDMETHHLYHAATKLAAEGLTMSAIAVRGISDFGIRKEKDEAYRPVAAANSADFILHAVQTGLIRKA